MMRTIYSVICLLVLSFPLLASGKYESQEELDARMAQEQLEKVYRGMLYEGQRNLMRLEEKKNLFSRSVSADHYGERVSASVCRAGWCFGAPLTVLTLPLTLITGPLCMAGGACSKEARGWALKESARSGWGWPFRVGASIANAGEAKQRKLALKKLIAKTSGRAPRVEQEVYEPPRERFSKEVRSGLLHQRIIQQYEKSVTQLLAEDIHYFPRPVFEKTLEDLDGDGKEETLRVYENGMVHLTRGARLILVQTNIRHEHHELNMFWPAGHQRGPTSKVENTSPIDVRRVSVSDMVWRTPTVTAARVMDLGDGNKALLLGISRGQGTYPIGLFEEGPRFLLNAPTRNVLTEASKLKVLGAGHLSAETIRKCDFNRAGAVSVRLELKYNSAERRFRVYEKARINLKNGCSMFSDIEKEKLKAKEKASEAHQSTKKPLRY